jgi:hypothetical protein
MEWREERWDNARDVLASQTVTGHPQRSPGRVSTAHIHRHSLARAYQQLQVVTSETQIATLLAQPREAFSMCRPWGLPHGPVLFAPGFISCLLSRTSPLGLVRAPFSI